MNQGKQKMQSKIALFLVVLLFVAALAPATFAETETLTVADLERDLLGTARIDRETALALALSASQAVESIEDGARALRDNARPVFDAADGQERFEKMYKELRKAYGDYLPSRYDYTKEEQYNYFYSMRIQAAPLRAELNKIELQFNTVEDQLAVNVDMLYSNLMYLIRTESLQKRYMDIQETLLTHYDAQYEAGYLSENDYETQKADVEIAKLTYQKIINERENLELQLKDLLGFSYDEPVYWVDSYVALSPMPLDSVDVYVASALENRNEIASAAFDYEAATEVYDLQVDAYYNISDVASARVDKARKADALEKTRQAVELEIHSAYDDLGTLYADFERAKLQYLNSKATYLRTQEQVELGVTVEVNLELLAFAMDSDYSAMQMAYVQYNLAIDRFLRASEYGPAYTSGGNS